MSRHPRHSCRRPSPVHPTWGSGFGYPFILNPTQRGFCAYNGAQPGRAFRVHGTAERALGARGEFLPGARGRIGGWHDSHDRSGRDASGSSGELTGSGGGLAQIGYSPTKSHETSQKLARQEDYRQSLEAQQRLAAAMVAADAAKYGRY